MGSSLFLMSWKQLHFSPSVQQQQRYCAHNFISIIIHRQEFMCLQKLKYYRRVTRLWGGNWEFYRRFSTWGWNVQNMKKKKKTVEEAVQVWSSCLLLSLLQGDHLRVLSWLWEDSWREGLSCWYDLWPLTSDLWTPNTQHNMFTTSITQNNEALYYFRKIY